MVIICICWVSLEYTCTELNSVLIFFFITALLIHVEVFGALLMILVVNTRLVAHGNFTEVMQS